jgi:hypothetical protein
MSYDKEMMVDYVHFVNPQRVRYDVNAVMMLMLLPMSIWRIYGIRDMDI